MLAPAPAQPGDVPAPTHPVAFVFHFAFKVRPARRCRRAARGAARRPSGRRPRGPPIRARPRAAGLGWSGRRPCAPLVSASAGSSRRRGWVDADARRLARRAASRPPGDGPGVLHPVRGDQQEPVRGQLCGLHRAAGDGLLDGAGARAPAAARASPRSGAPPRLGLCSDPTEPARTGAPAASLLWPAAQVRALLPARTSRASAAAHARTRCARPTPLLPTLPR
jgi:hypothetical protein